MGFPTPHEKKKEFPGEQTVDLPRCPVCAERAEAGSAALCYRCRTPHHAECWEFNKGCGRYGCGSRIRTWVSAAVQAGRPPHVEFTRGVEPGLQQLLLVAWSLSLVLVPLLAAPLGRAASGLAFAAWAATSWLVPLVTGTFGIRTRLDPAHRRVRTEYRLGDLVLCERARELPFERVRGLYVLPGRASTGRRARAWETWLVPEEGPRVLLSVDHEERDEVLARADAAARVLDTVVSLPAAHGLVREESPALPPAA